MKDKPKGFWIILEMCHQQMASASSRVWLPPSHATRNIPAWVLFVPFMELITCHLSLLRQSWMPTKLRWRWKIALTMYQPRRSILIVSYVIFWREDVLWEWWYYKANQVLSIMEHWDEIMWKQFEIGFATCDGIKSEARYGTQCTSWNDVVCVLLLHWV